MRWLPASVALVLLSTVLSGCADEPVALTMDEVAAKLGTQAVAQTPSNASLNATQGDQAGQATNATSDEPVNQTADANQTEPLEPDAQNGTDDGMDNQTAPAGNDTTSEEAPASAEPVAVLAGTVLTPDPLAIVGGFCTTDLFLGIGTGSVLGNHWAVDSSWIGLDYAVEPATLLVTFFDGAGFPSGHSGKVPTGASDVVVCGVGPTDALVDFTVAISAP